MKNFVRIIVMLVASVMAGYLSPDGVKAAGGVCSACHVMHASLSGTTNTPQGFLLKDDCLGCHSGDSSAAPNTSTNAPKVYVTAGNELAGGSFKHIDDNDDSYGHNPVELGNNEDTAAKIPPPGWKNGFANNDGGQIGDNTANGGWAADKLSCNGVYGCHGAPTADGLQGAHHTNLNAGADGEATGAAGTPGAGYRFLQGIKGWEDDVYEWGVGATPANGAHNIYYSEARAADAVSDKQTISYFCAECHGIFHSGAGTEGPGDASFASPWIRHPVDISMPGGVTEYADYTAYRTDAPVGSSDVTDNAMTVANAGDRIVMCLSCHRAHASAYPSSLRWDYSKMLSGSAAVGDRNTGCFACHTDKDGAP